jgi:hypothetical protein
MQPTPGTGQRTAPDDAAVAAAANALTERWAGALPDGAERSTVFSGAGVWPLLGLLALGAAGATRRRLAAAFGLDLTLAEGAVRRLLNVFDASDSMYAACGLWQHPDVVLDPVWRDAVPPGTRGELTGDPGTDQDRLDAWARDQTRGMIERAPVTVTPDTVLMLASAVSLETAWATPFTKQRHTAHAGPWRAEGLAWLERAAQSEDLARVDGPAGPVTLARVPGKADLDVYLLLGAPQATAASTLGTALAALGGAYPVVPASAWSGPDPAPGASVAPITNPSGRPELRLGCPPFAFQARHDLLALPGVFGLQPGGEYPGIGSARGLPLGVGQAAQGAMTQFTELGFKAAAITAVGVRAMAVARPLAPKPTTRTTVAFDRPFGFAAVHRASGLVPVAGWVARPGSD